MATTTTSVADACAAAKAASLALARAADRGQGRGAGRDGRAARASAPAAILEANAADLADERARVPDRGAARPADARPASGSRRWPTACGQIVALPDPVGEEIERAELASGLELRKVRVPLGVVAVVYEARPNVTVDCAALTIKSGNAIVLRGSCYAERSNGALAAIVREAAGARPGCPRTPSCCSRPATARSSPSWRPRTGCVDLLIPRGGEGLKEALKEVATVPVIYAAAGNCHVYVHDDADLEMARRIAYNAKVQRPGVCNSAETLLVHRRASRPPSCRAILGRAARGRRRAGRGRARRARTPARSRSGGRAPRTGTPSTST